MNDFEQELNDAQVSVVHVSGNSKNAADDKLRQAMRRFADVYTTIMPPDSPPATIILISGDINFATDLSDLRYRLIVTVFFFRFALVRLGGVLRNF